MLKCVTAAIQNCVDLDTLSTFLRHTRIKNTATESHLHGLLYAVATHNGQCTCTERTELIEELLEFEGSGGAKVDVNRGMPGAGWTALHQLAYNDWCPAGMRLLLSRSDIDPNVMSRRTKTERFRGMGPRHVRLMTPLMMAAWRESTQSVRLLLNHSRTRVNIKNGDGKTALLLAANSEHIKMLLMQARTRTQANITEHAGVKTVQMPVAAGRQNCSGNTGSNSLQTNHSRLLRECSVAIEFHRCILSLIKAGVDVNTLHRDGNALLHFAVTTDRYEVVNFLVNNCPCADVNLENGDGNTALHLSVKNKYRIKYTRVIVAGGDVKEVIVRILLKSRRTDVNRKVGGVGDTALLIALRLCHDNFAKMLLADHRTDVNAVGRDGMSALRLALPLLRMRYNPIPFIGDSWNETRRCSAQYLRGGT